MTSEEIRLLQKHMNKMIEKHQGNVITPPVNHTKQRIVCSTPGSVTPQKISSFITISKIVKTKTIAMPKIVVVVPCQDGAFLVPLLGSGSSFGLRPLLAAGCGG